MLSHQQIELLEQCWEVLDKLRNCRDFNESHDLTIGDACSVLSDFLDHVYQKERDECNQPLPSVDIASLESFRNL